MIALLVIALFVGGFVFGMAVQERERHYEERRRQRIKGSGEVNR